MRTTKERDDIIYKLEKVAKFYNKKSFDTDDARTWLNALADFSVEAIEKAFDEHINESKFFPKPVEIRTNIREANPPARSPFEPQGDCNCDPRIQSAWITYIREAHHFNMPGDSVMLFEEALPIVQGEAKKYGRMDALLEEHRI